MDTMRTATQYCVDTHGFGTTRSLCRLVQLATHCTAASSRTPNEIKAGSPDSRNSMSLGDAVAVKKPGATNQADAGRTAGARLSLATCQFGISADVRHNVAEVKRQMREVRPHPWCQTLRACVGRSSDLQLVVWLTAARRPPLKGLI